MHKFPLSFQQDSSIDIQKEEFFLYDNCNQALTLLLKNTPPSVHTLLNSSEFSKIISFFKKGCSSHQFLFHGDGLDPCLLYNVTNFSPQFIRHSIYQIGPLNLNSTLLITQSLKSISHFHCIIIRDLIQVIPEWSSGFPYFLLFKSEFGNKEFMV